RSRRSPSCTRSRCWRATGDAMIRRLHLLLFWLLAAVAVAQGATPAKDGTTKIGKAPANAAGRAVIERVAWEAVEGHKKLVVAVRGVVDFTTHTAGSDGGLPPRVYVDLRPAILGKDVLRTPQAIDDPLAQRLRVGQFSADTVRVVVDLSAP